MIDSDRLRKIKNFQDIKLEKARLRYEALLAEGRLFEDLNAIQNQFTFPLFFEKFRLGFSYTQRILSGVQSALGWMFKKKNRPYQNESA